MMSEIGPVLAKSLLDTTIKELGKTDIECEKELTIRQKFEQEQITIRHEQEQINNPSVWVSGLLEKKLNWNRLTNCNYVNLRSN